MGKDARFETGKPADPCQNMSEEDCQVWKDMNEEHGDKFKKAAVLYRTLNDAASIDPRYGKSGAKIWYAKDKYPNGFMMGLNWLKERGIEIPTLKTLSQTHDFVGEIGSRDPEEIFELMQGERWSPNGEARGMIPRVADHTSMSVGDIIQIGRTLYFVDNFGMKKLGASKLAVGDIPADVERYVKETQEGNPDYTDAQAWATAWSRYCKWKDPSSEHCHMNTGDYFPGRKASRSLSDIAREIRRDWKSPNYAAVPYLQAMASLDSVNDDYGADSGKSVVLYFLNNAGAWRGETAKRIKTELKQMVGMRGASDLEALQRLATWEEGEREDDDPRDHEGEGSMIPGLEERRASIREASATYDRYEGTGFDLLVRAGTPVKDLKPFGNVKPVGQNLNWQQAIARTRGHEVDLTDMDGEPTAYIDKHSRSGMLPRVIREALENEPYVNIGKEDFLTDVMASLEQLAKEDYPWEQCIKDKEADPKVDNPEAVCGWIKNKSQGGGKAAMQEDLTLVNPASALPGDAKESMIDKPGPGLVAEGCPDNLDEKECGVWEQNTDKYKDKFKTAKRVTITQLAELLERKGAEPKDFQRIKDIITKSKGNENKMESLAIQMANSITGYLKAYRRYFAAEALDYSWSIAPIFYERFQDLVRTGKAASEEPPNLDLLALTQLAEGCPDNLDPAECQEWEKNTEKYKDVVKDQHRTATLDIESAWGAVIGANPVDEKEGRFEEDKPADPTENMSPEDAKRWREEHNKHKDEFKAAGTSYIYEFGSMKTAKAPTGLYGYTKAVQSDCETCIRKLSKAASGIAKRAYGKDEKVAEFLSTHAKQGESLPAQILVAAMKDLGPKVASTKTAAHHEEGGKWYVDTAFINQVQYVYPDATLEHMGFGEFVLKTPDGDLEFDRIHGKDFEGQSGRSHLLYDNAHGKVAEKAIKLMEQHHKSEKMGSSDKQARLEELRELRASKELNFKDEARAKESGYTVVFKKGYDTRGKAIKYAQEAASAGKLKAPYAVAKMTDGGFGIFTKPGTSKEAGRSYGLYGFLSKTANLGLSACTELRENAGQITASLHGRRADRHEHITGFFDNHAKTANCIHSRLLRSSYPGADMRCASAEAVPGSVDEWLAWDSEN